MGVTSLLPLLPRASPSKGILPQEKKRFLVTRLKRLNEQLIRSTEHYHSLQITDELDKVSSGTLYPTRHTPTPYVLLSPSTPSTPPVIPNPPRPIPTPYVLLSPSTPSTHPITRLAPPQRITNIRNRLISDGKRSMLQTVKIRKE